MTLARIEDPARTPMGSFLLLVKIFSRGESDFKNSSVINMSNSRFYKKWPVFGICTFGENITFFVFAQAGGRVSRAFVESQG